MPDKKDVSSLLVVVANTLTKKQTEKNTRMTHTHTHTHTEIKDCHTDTE